MVGLARPTIRFRFDTIFLGIKMLGVYGIFVNPYAIAGKSV
jgi:hypothetical protein